MRRLALAAAVALAPSLACAEFANVGPTPPTSDNGDRLATTAWVNNFFANGLPLANGKIWIGSAGGIAVAQTPSGDCTLSASGVITCTQSAGPFTVNGLLTVTGNLSVAGSIIDGSGILATNIAAPATPAAGTTRIYIDSSTKVLTFKNDAGVVGNAVVPWTCAASQFGISMTAAGVHACAQPAVGDISGFGTSIATVLGKNLNASGAIISPTPTRAGDVPFWNGTVWGSLAGNNSGTNCLQESSAGVPSWATCGGLTVGTTAIGSPVGNGPLTNASSVLGNALWGQLPGIATGTAASAGNVGEYIKSNIATPGSSLTSNVATNVTSVSLTPGEWSCSGNIYVGLSGTVSFLSTWINLVSATLPTPPNGGGLQQNSNTSAAATIQSAGTIDFVITSNPTTVFLGVEATFTATATTAGFLGCTRTH